jgi:hypothetical protein
MYLFYAQLKYNHVFDPLDLIKSYYRVIPTQVRSIELQVLSKSVHVSMVFW